MIMYLLILAPVVYLCWGVWEFFIKKPNFYLKLIELAAYMRGTFDSDYILAAQNQARIETGNFGFPNAGTIYANKNMFGMKDPKKRKTTSIGDGRGGFALYKTWFASAQDIFLWYDMVGISPGMTYQQITNAIVSNGYAEDEKYQALLDGQYLAHSKASRPAFEFLCFCFIPTVLVVILALVMLPSTKGFFKKSFSWIGKIFKKKSYLKSKL